jgi:hypothetical protein
MGGGGRVCRNHIGRSISFGNKFFIGLLPKEAQSYELIGS